MQIVVKQTGENPDCRLMQDITHCMGYYPDDYITHVKTKRFAAGLP